MTNAEYFKEEFAAICPERTFCDFIKEHVLPAFNTECEGLFCEDCQKMLAIWTAQEYKKPEFTPGQIIWVRNTKQEEWRLCKFVRHEKSVIVCCYLQQDLCNTISQLNWQYFKPLTKEEKKMLDKHVLPDTPYGTWIKVRNSQEDPWKVRRFLHVTNDFKVSVDDKNMARCYCESAALTDEDYYKMQLS